MKRLALVAVLFLSVAAAIHAQELNRELLENWPNWRGPNNDGTAPFGNPPTEWSEDNHVRWKIEVPGLGNATPIIWKNQVFILTAIETDKAPAAESKSEEKSESKTADEKDKQQEARKDSQKGPRDQ